MYAAIMAVVFAAAVPGPGRAVAVIGGLLASGPLYLGLGYVLAKFGYQRKTLAEMRTPRASPSGSPTRATRPATAPRPAPTRRTSTGPNRPSAKSRKRDDDRLCRRHRRRHDRDPQPGVPDRRHGRRSPSYREFTQHFPRPGWVEHDAVEIWEAARDTLRDVVDRVGPSAVAAIGITNQRETVVAWDRTTGKPYGRAIVWQDRRTAARCDELAAEGALDLVRRRTGLVLDPYFSGTKFEWLLGEGGVPVSADLALGTVDTWLIWNLTGGEVYATDATNASRTMLFDIERWRGTTSCATCSTCRSTGCPRCTPSSGRVGVTSDRCGAPAGIPVSGIAGDQQAALFGQACFDAGMAKNTYGTGSFVLLNVGDERPPPAEGMLTTVAWTLADGTVAYALEGAIFSPARRSSGCATGSASSATPPRSGRSRRASTTPAACTSCRRSPGSARRGGTPTPAARSSASRAGRRGRTSPGRSSSRWPTRHAMPSRRWWRRAGAAHRAARRRRGGGDGRAAADPGRSARRPGAARR